MAYFYGDPKKEIVGEVVDIGSTMVKMRFEEKDDTYSIPISYFKERTKLSRGYKGKVILPIWFLKRNRIIPIIDPI